MMGTRDSGPETQLAKLQRLMGAGEWHNALRLAARWRRLGDQRQAIQRGWEASVRPGFYREIGHDPDKLVREGIAALNERYGG